MWSSRPSRAAREAVNAKAAKACEVARARAGTGIGRPLPTYHGGGDVFTRANILTEAAIRIAYKHSSDALRATARHLDLSAMSVMRQKQRVAYAYLVEQRRCVQEWLQRLRDASGKVQFVIQKSKFDETPAALWTALETEVDAISHISTPMKAAEMFAQRRWLLAAPDVDARRCPKATARQVICPPAHLESTSARCTAKALQRRQPLGPCNMPRGLLEHVQWVWAIQVAGSAASN